MQFIKILSPWTLIGGAAAVPAEGIPGSTSVAGNAPVLTDQQKALAEKAGAQGIKGEAGLSIAATSIRGGEPGDAPADPAQFTIEIGSGPS